MKIASVKQISLNKSTRQIEIIVDAKDSLFIQEPSFKENGFPQLINGASIVDGVNLILEHHFNAVNAIKKMIDRTPFESSNERNELIDALTVLLSLATEPKNKYEKLAQEKASNILKSCKE
jgi:hypothetical protein